MRSMELVVLRPTTRYALTLRFDENYIKKRQGCVPPLINYKRIKVRGVLYPLHVSGSRELMQIGYECGFGDKNSAGFGMEET